MLIYWLLFTFFAVGAFITPASHERAYAMPGGPVAGPQRTPFRFAFAAGALITICLIGLRYKVGTDWFNYLEIFRQSQRVDFSSALGIGDPGYQILNRLAYDLGFKIWFVNLLSAAVFGWGLFRFCRAQPSPWLAATIAIPYMVIVVAMGYTRQSIALGILMAGLANQARGASIVNLLFYVVAAAIFHKTAVVVFPLVALAGKGSPAIRFAIAICASILLYDFFLSDAMGGFVRTYIDAEYSSQGAFIRVAMNCFAAILLWVFGKRLDFSVYERRIWMNFSIAAIVSMVALAISPSSTAVDRVSLYLLPLQIAILTRVALVGGRRVAGTLAVVAYLFVVQFVWLNFSDNARYWVPYQFYAF